VEDKQAQFVLKEINSKISKLKTKSIKTEKLPVHERIRKCVDLISIFGKECMSNIADGFEEREEMGETIEVIYQSD
jgi:hypothetical protein